MGGYAALCLYLDTEQGSQWLAREAANRLSAHIGAQVDIQQAHIGLPGHVTLHGVSLWDRADSLMLSAERLEGSIAWTDLLSTGKIRLRSIALLDGEAHIYQTRSDTALNIQFLLDAFQSPDAPSRPTDVRISQLVVRRYAVRYDNYEKPQPAPRHFDAAHIAVSHLSASIALQELTDTLLHAQIRSLAFQERSGLDVRHLQAEVWRDEHSLRLHGLELRLPSTQIRQDDLSLYFESRDPLSTLHTAGQLSDAYISTDDIAMLLPELAACHTNVRLSTAFDISPGRIVLSDTQLHAQQPNIDFAGQMQALYTSNGLTQLSLRDAMLSTNTTSLAQFLSSIGQSALPPVVAQLGQVDFNGNLSWEAHGAAAFDGTLSTAQGALSGKAQYTPEAITGSLQLDQLHLADLLQQPELPSPISAHIDGRVALLQGNPQSFDGKLQLLQALYRGRLVSHIDLEGHLSTQDIAMQIDSRDAAASLYGHLTAHLQDRSLQEVRWEGIVEHFEPALWGLDVPAGTVVSLDGTVLAKDFAQLSHIDATATLHHLNIHSPTTHIDQHDITLHLQPQDGIHHVSLQMPYGEVNLQGTLDVERMQRAVEGIVMLAIPDFAPLFWEKARPNDIEEATAWHISANIADDALFRDLLHIPVTAPEGLTLEGVIAEGNGRTDLTLKADTLSYDQQGFKHINLFLQGEGKEYSLLVQTEKELAGMQMELAATVQTTGSEISTQLSWRDQKDVFRGELSANTFAPHDRHSALRTELSPTEIFFKDSVWTLHEGTIAWGADTLSVSRLFVQHEAQHLIIDGAFSQGSPDSITADLHAIDLEYVFDLLKFYPVYFAGIANGHATLTFADERPVVKARLSIDDFSINHGPLGTADIKGEVDLKELTVRLNADLLEAPMGRTLVNGYILPKQEELDLDIESHSTNLQFLRQYIGGILHDFSGRATGHSRLYGGFKSLQLTGDVMAQVDGGIPVLGCNYQVDSAHVVMTPGLIDIRSGIVHDINEGTAKTTAQVHHQYLGHFAYNFDFDLDHCLIYDRPRSYDMTFASHALASGHVNVKGGDGRLDCDINVRPEQGSNFRYHIDLPEDYTSSNLLTIRPAPTAADSSKTEVKTHIKQQASTGSDVYMTLNLDMRPDVPLTVVMDEKTGDNIVVRGSGPLRATYYNKGQFNLFGTYTIESGIYKMTIQDIIHKDFHFQEGGTVVFSGKPFEGIMNMQAVYTVPSASLSDLNLTSGVSQNGVRVNCLLNFSGQVQDPKVHFDLDMPTVSQDVKQMVRSLISTDEEMNRQVLYLLAIGRFYTYDYSSTEQTQSLGETAMNSFLSNTLSGQLNNFIASAMGQSNWTFGTNLSTGNYGWEDVGVEGQIGGRLLGNRLLINGNFGYRNSATQQGGTLIGDFDVQYLLTPGGSIRLKAYNETNDRYFTKNSLTTQGAGIAVGRSFNRLSDIFKRKKKNEDAENPPQP